MAKSIFTVRDYVIQNVQTKSTKRTVRQYHYTSWPDHGVPPNPSDVLEFLRVVKDYQASLVNPGAILAHCRCAARIGRRRWRRRASSCG